jgi:hypothetical protein
MLDCCALTVELDSEPLDVALLVRLTVTIELAYQLAA